MEYSRQKNRTRDALIEALMTLTVEVGFESITVSLIAQRANVGRSTFYAHYADKEDLLLDAHQDLRRYLETSTAGENSEVHPALQFVLPMLIHAQELKPFLRATKGQRSGELIQIFALDIWQDYIRSRWEEGQEVEVQAISGALYHTLHWWIFTSANLTAEEINRMFCSLFESKFRVE